MKHIDWTLFRHHFKNSTWVSACWNWFLLLTGKAAEPFLCLSVLYQGATLLPGITIPATVSTAMFLGQQLALDIGGMSLAKQAQKTKEAGNEEQAKVEKRVGFTLIGLMIANVVLAYLQRLNILPSNIVSGVEAILLIFRAIMAVVYGYLLYSPSETASSSVVKTSDVNQRLDQFTELLKGFNQQVQSIPQLVHSQTQATIQEVVQGVVHSAVQSVVQDRLNLVVEEVQYLSSQLPTIVQEQVQAMVTEQVQPLLQDQIREVVQALEGGNNSGELKQLLERLQEVSTSVQEMRTTITQVRTVTHTERTVKGSKSGSVNQESELPRVVQSKLVQPKSEPALELSSEPVDARVKRFIVEQSELGHTPSLSEIMNQCQCARNTAIRYRRELLGDDGEENNEPGQRVLKIVGQ